MDGEKADFSKKVFAFCRRALAKNSPRGQGRKSSWRKERGCVAFPFRLTFAGNADKIKVFWLVIVENEKGLQVEKLQDKGVAEPKSLYFTKKNEGLQVYFACVHSRFVLWYETAFSIPGEGDKMALPKDKCKFSLWLYPETLDRVKELYQRDDCQSQSEFIEKAIRFYVGFLRADDESSYLPNAFLSNLKSIVAESDIRQSRMLFKIAVEMAMMMNVLAASQDIDGATLTRLRGECIKEVKRLNGNFTMEDACEWQKG